MPDKPTLHNAESKCNDGLAAATAMTNDANLKCYSEVLLTFQLGPRPFCLPGIP